MKNYEFRAGFFITAYKMHFARAFAEARLKAQEELNKNIDEMIDSKANEFAEACLDIIKKYEIDIKRENK